MLEAIKNGTEIIWLNIWYIYNRYMCLCVCASMCECRIYLARFLYGKLIVLYDKSQPSINGKFSSLISIPLWDDESLSYWRINSKTNIKIHNRAKTEFLENIVFLDLRLMILGLLTRISISVFMLLPQFHTQLSC